MIQKAVIQLIYNHAKRLLILVFDDYKTEFIYGEDAIKKLKELDFDE